MAEKQLIIDGFVVREDGIQVPLEILKVSKISFKDGKLSRLTLDVTHE
ncbi:hypothetical protein GS425_17335 [Rhodococcus hoagii]|nr:hypothetical protein [Prescottella equi]